MADRFDCQNDAAADTGAAGCVVFLIDESTAMDTCVADGTKSKAGCIATALNSLLNQLTDEAELELTVVGYRGDDHDGVDVGCRWAGPLEGQTFVRSSRLTGAPLTVENRVRKIPGPGGISVAREETIQFPVWYVPTLAGAASPEAAYGHCHELLCSRLSAPL